MLMVQAGPGTDATIQALLPHLDKGDILIDGGNTFYKDTIRRNEELARDQLYRYRCIWWWKKVPLKVLLSCLVTKKEAYDLVADVLEEILQSTWRWKPCVTYIGPDGAGHYVKMVHNGIEYGDMQLIAESYDLMQHLLGLLQKTWLKSSLNGTRVSWTATWLKSQLISWNAKTMKVKMDQS